MGAGTGEGVTLTSGAPPRPDHGRMASISKRSGFGSSSSFGPPVERPCQHRRLGMREVLAIVDRDAERGEQGRQGLRRQEAAKRPEERPPCGPAASPTWATPRWCRPSRMPTAGADRRAHVRGASLQHRRTRTGSRHRTRAARRPVKRASRAACRGSPRGGGRGRRAARCRALARSSRGASTGPGQPALRAPGAPPPRTPCARRR